LTIGSIVSLTETRRPENGASHVPAPAPVEQISFGELACRFLTCNEQQMTAGELHPASYRDLLTRTAHLKKVLGNVSKSNLTVPILDEAIRSLQKRR
jgi:hypothetical protein